MDVRFPIHKVLLVEDRRVIVVYPRTTGTNSSVNCNKTADLNRIAASDLAVQRRLTVFAQNVFFVHLCK